MMDHLEKECAFIMRFGLRFADKMMQRTSECNLNPVYTSSASFKKTSQTDSITHANITADPPFRTLNKDQNILAWFRGKHFQSLNHCFTQTQITGVKKTIKPLEFGSFVETESGTSQPNGIQPAHGVVGHGHHERRQIFANPGPALHHGQRSDPGKLVHHAVSRNEGTVLNHDVPRDQGAVGKGIVVSNVTIMSHMRVGHEKVPLTDDGIFFLTIGTMDRDVLAKDIFRTDPQSGRLLTVLQILRGIPDDGTCMKPAAFPCFEVSGQMHVRTDLADRPQANGLVNHGKSTHPNGRMQLGIGMHNSGGMYQHASTVKISELT